MGPNLTEATAAKLASELKRLNDQIESVGGLRSILAKGDVLANQISASMQRFAPDSRR